MASNLYELKNEYDVIVVGARVAGGATAMLLARAGVNVLLVDQGQPGTDTLSTLALMRGGVLQLARWGLLDSIKASGTPKIEQTTFHYGTEAIEIPIKPRDGVDALYAPRRTVLDPLLWGAAETAGAELAWRAKLMNVVHNDDGRVSGVLLMGPDRQVRRIDAALVIGADGMYSSVAQRVGAEPYHRGVHQSGVIYTFVKGLDLSGYHWYFTPGASAGVIPTAGGETLVFVAVPRERFMSELRTDLSCSFHTVLRDVAPTVAAAMKLPTKTQFRGFAGHPTYMRPATGPGWALVGDAGYFKDPLTAHGLTDALRDAELLARAVAGGTDAALARYQSTRDALSREFFDLTDEIASYDWTLGHLQSLHRSMSDAMGREVVYLVGLNGAAGASAKEPYGPRSLGRSDRAPLGNIDAGARPYV